MRSRNHSLMAALALGMFGGISNADPVADYPIISAPTIVSQRQWRRHSGVAAARRTAKRRRVALRSNPRGI